MVMPIIRQAGTWSYHGNERGAITRRSCCSEFTSQTTKGRRRNSAAHKVCRQSAASLL